MDVETAQTIEDMFFITCDNNVVTIECNYCDKDGYMFSTANSYGNEIGWFHRALIHFEQHHPEHLP